jgi:hypothetical protein
MSPVIIQTLVGSLITVKVAMLGTLNFSGNKTPDI